MLLLGVEGAIIGKALYAGNIDLKSYFERKMLIMEFIKDLKFDEKGLIPAVAQDAVSGEILMLAYMNEESIKQTIETGHAVYF